MPRTKDTELAHARTRLELTSARVQLTSPLCVCGGTVPFGDPEQTLVCLVFYFGLLHPFLELRPCLVAR